jgi:hypothetical protein
MSTFATPLSPSVYTGAGPPNTYAENYNLVIDGDDIAIDGYQYPDTNFEPYSGVGPPAVSLFYTAVGTNMLITNVAVAGQTLTTMIANGAANVDSKISGTKTNVLVVTTTATADATGGANASTIAGRFATYIAARVTAGWKVILVGLTQSSGNAAVWSAVNALLKANYASYGALGYGDVSADFALGVAGVYTNMLWYNSDQLTLNANGVVRFNDVVITAVKAGLGL